MIHNYILMRICHRAVSLWVFVLWLPVLFWKVTLLSFQVTCSSSCVTGLIVSPDSWLCPPVPHYPHVSYSLCLPLSCARVFSCSWVPQPASQSSSCYRPCLYIWILFSPLKSDFFFVDNFLSSVCRCVKFISILFASVGVFFCFINFTAQSCSID